MRSVTLTGNKRDQVGSKDSKALRQQEKVPCVLYGNGKNVNFTLDYLVASKIIYTPDFFKVAVNVDGNVYECIIKDIQFHKLNDSIQHIDFLELNPDKKVICDIPIKLIGLAKGVREGGKMLVKVRKLRVKAYPKDLVETIDINVESLELGKSVKVSDVKVSGLEIQNAMSIPIASVEITRALKSAATEAAKAEASKKK